MSVSGNQAAQNYPSSSIIKIPIEEDYTAKNKQHGSTEAPKPSSSAMGGLCSGLEGVGLILKGLILKGLILKGFILKQFKMRPFKMKPF
ncbi:Oidioi.mRNA.OKI2018_I69.chr1.g1321.t1.cds [Oikopleura dioica]|uniref:Oidioi.mRNA.OKI2018_I69.chr1.g1321.t1.cds n=1 Tax=Oikopleura dioica TaxID=34765 RepID=A0ABN7STW6_OIKDI|nr:Oidioi.mRNA.OKI2018_I69.chr1.g1321.t1.cds [Oikopleura dioica]